MFNTRTARFLGFRGIVSNISDEFLTTGYVPDMENVTINMEGLAENMPNPAEEDLFANVNDWSAATYIQLGCVILPTVKTTNKHFFICTTAGTSGGSEPTWQTAEGNSTPDNTVIWIEAGETTDEVRNLYYWADYDDPFLMVCFGKWAVIDTKHGYGHRFSCNVNYPISFASIMSDGSTKLYIMSYEDGLFWYTPHLFTDVHNPTNGKPPYSGHIISYQNRLWAYGMLEESGGGVGYNRLRYSELPGDPETDPATPNLGARYWDADSYYDIITEGHDAITAVIPFGQALFIFTKNNIHALSGYGATHTLTEVYSGFDGSEDSYVVGVDSIYYIGSDGFKMFATPYPTTISDIIEPSISSDIGTPQGVTYFEDRIYFLINGTLWGYHLLRKTWEKYNYSNANCLCSGDHLYLGTSDGKCYKLDVAGTGYLSWYIKTPNTGFGNLYINKRFLALKSYYKTTDAAATLKIDFYLNNSSSGTALTDVDTYEAGETDEMRENHQQTISDVAKTIQYKFYGDDQVRLFGYDLDYKVRWKKRV